MAASSQNRRQVLATIGAVVSTAGLCAPSLAQSSPRVVVIGGGFAGATAARAIKAADSRLAVSLIESNRTFTACPFSNLVIAGLRELTAQQFGYDKLAASGVEVVFATASGVDAGARRVALDNGGTLSYDRLVVAPGIDIHWDGLAGYGEAAAETMPHAWKAGAQTLLLRRQLEALEDGGLVVMSVPANPFRCPPGPYERASLIAHYLKTHKPKSKILILDAKDTFTKQALFRAAWARLYPGVLEWVSGSQGGRVSRIDPRAGTVHTDFDEYKPAVANIVPPQRAAAIARAAGLDDGKGWCTVQPRTFESTVHPGIHL